MTKPRAKKLLGRPHLLTNLPGQVRHCDTCKATGLELLSTCPGHPLSDSTLRDCYEGKVADFVSYRRVHMFVRGILGR